MSPRDLRTSRHFCSAQPSFRNATPSFHTMVQPTLKRAMEHQERGWQSVNFDLLLFSVPPANYYAAKLAIAKASKDNRGFVEELLDTLEKVRSFLFLKT